MFVCVRVCINTFIIYTQARTGATQARLVARHLQHREQSHHYVTITNTPMYQHTQARLRNQDLQCRGLGHHRTLILVLFCKNGGE